MRKETGRRKASESQDPLKRNRTRCIGPEIMNSWHTKVGLKYGQGGERRYGYGGSARLIQWHLLCGLFRPERSKRFDVGKSDIWRESRAALKLGIQVLTILLISTYAHAQGENSKAAAENTAANSIYSQGMNALQRRDLAAARAAFEKTVQMVPRSPEPHNSLGWVLLAQGETDAAVLEFKDALRLKPDFVQ